MQRLFSMFPAGLPGVALLLLRIAIAGLLSVSTLSNAPAENISGWMAVSVGSTCLLLMIGALTPLASLTAVAIEATFWLRTDGLTSASLALDMLVSLSMFFLGPGAYSLDSKMFGRRLILPNSK
jgi:hypothetical protein